MRFDLKNFKKIGADKTSTTLAHPDGHEITLSHKKLSPKMREQLAALPGASDKMPKPVKMAGGGEIEPDINKEKKGLGARIGYPGSVEPDPVPSDKPEKDPIKLADGGAVEPDKQKTLGSTIGYPGADPTPPVKMADGGDPKDAPTEAPAAPAVAPAAAPVTINLNTGPQGMTGATGSPMPQAAPPPAVTPVGMTGVTGAPSPEQPPQQGDPLGNPHEPPMEAQRAPQGAPMPQAAAQAPVAAPQPAPQGGDMWGNQAYSEAFTKGLGEQKAGLAQEAAAQQAQGAASAQALQAQVATQQKATEVFQAHAQELNKERQAFMADMKNQHIDPSHYLSSMGVMGKIGTAIGLILGGLGAADGSGRNPASDFLDHQIDRDIDAQKANLGKQNSLLEANMQQFKNMRDATDMTRVMQSDIVSNQLKEAAAKASGPMAKAKALQAAGQLDTQSAATLSQIAMRKTLLSGMQAGQIPPEMVLRSGVIATNDHEAFRKETEAAQTAVSLRDNTMSSFDQLANINTVLGKLNPQTRLQVAALKGAALDKLTKDVSGRVTPETVKLIGSLFDTAIANPESIGTMRRQLNNLLTQGMHYPTLKAYNQDPANWGRYKMSGANRIQESAPVR